MPLNFPNSPANNDIYTDTASGATYTYDATRSIWKNQSGGGGGSSTITNQTNANELQYVIFTTTTTGQASSLNVASSKLTYNINSGTLSSTIFNSTSDANKKNNIITIQNSLDTVQSLRGVSFDWKENRKPSYGLIAQEVEKVIPAIVESDIEGSKTLNYDALIGFLIEAVKELSDRVQKLENK